VRFALLQGTDDADIQITDVRNINDVQITEVQIRGLQIRGLQIRGLQIRGLQIRGLPIMQYKMRMVDIGLRTHCANKNSMD
jgi:hypothetical protein